MTASDDLVWVFGYGSLIWRPAMAYVARRASRIDGWARRFWQASTDHRGTVEAPGRVLTLVESDGAVWGMAYANRARRVAGRSSRRSSCASSRATPA